MKKQKTFTVRCNVDYFLTIQAENFDEAKRAAEKTEFSGWEKWQAGFSITHRLDVPDDDDNRFGACPVCGGSDGYLNLGRNHYFVCHEHKFRWCVGENLFSSWRHETEADWHKNWELISEYRELKLGDVRCSSPAAT